MVDPIEVERLRQQAASAVDKVDSQAHLSILALIAVAKSHPDEEMGREALAVVNDLHSSVDFLLATVRRIVGAPREPSAAERARS